MSVRSLTTDIWKAPAFLPFKVSAVPPFPFSNPWFKEHHPDLMCGMDSKKGNHLRGGYWVVTDLSDTALKNAVVDLPTEERRTRGSGKYVSIGYRATETLNDLGGNVCTTKLHGLRVVYNGHEGWARGRLGGHYKSLDPRTGALRVSQHQSFPAKGRWGAAIFTEDMIQNLTPELRLLASRLVASKLGRTVLEMEWRSLYGWPLLCRG